jgi:hypothetical protein
MTTTEPETLTLAKARIIASDPDRLAELIGAPYQDWTSRCHEISLKLLRTGEFGRGRIARGRAAGVASQHSWIVLGDDCYNPEAVVVDPTVRLWLQRAGIDGGSPDRPLILVDYARNLSHRPHGGGLIWEEAGPPPEPTGDVIELTPTTPLSREARDFLDSLGPLDIHGWMTVAHYPVQGWPAGEIFAAMDDTKPLSSLIPIDILGMATDRNPEGLYR